MSKYFKNQDLVIHLAANADVKNGLKNNKIDLEQNTIATHNVKEVLDKVITVNLYSDLGVIEKSFAVKEICLIEDKYRNQISLTTEMFKEQTY